jgi:penicillin-binding protein 2
VVAQVLLDLRRVVLLVLLDRHRLRGAGLAAVPIDAPTVALAVVVENAGFGSDSAAPIARRVFDYLLLGQYPSEEDLAGVAQGKVVTPIGKPRPAADVPLPGQASPLAVLPQPAKVAATR